MDKLFIKSLLLRLIIVLSLKPLILWLLDVSKVVCINWCQNLNKTSSSKTNIDCISAETWDG